MAHLLYRLGRFAARRAWAVIVAWVAVLVIAGGAFAQGRGGFGGRFGGGFGGGMLLRMPEVQTELKLTEEQKTKLTEMQERLRAERRWLGRAACRESV